MIDLTLGGHSLVVWLQVSIYFDILEEETKKIEEKGKKIGKNQRKSKKTEENRQKSMNIDGNR